MTMPTRVPSVSNTLDLPRDSSNQSLIPISRGVGDTETTLSSVKPQVLKKVGYIETFISYLKNLCVRLFKILVSFLFFNSQELIVQDLTNQPIRQTNRLPERIDRLPERIDILPEVSELPFLELENLNIENLDNEQLQSIRGTILDIFSNLIESKKKFLLTKLGREEWKRFSVWNSSYLSSYESIGRKVLNENPERICNYLQDLHQERYRV